MSNPIYISGARASFPWIASPQEQINDKGEKTYSYSCDLIIAPDDTGYRDFMAAYSALAADKWKENAQNAMNQIHTDKRTRCYGNGSEKVSQKTFTVHPGYAGNVYLTSRNSRQPQIFGADGKVIDPNNTMQLRAEAAKIYGGCYVNAVVKPWIQQNTKGIGIRCELMGIQFVKDGDPFGAGAAADLTSMFGAVAGAPVAAAPGVQMPAAPFQMPSFLG